MKHRLAPLLEGMEMGKSEHDWLEQRLESMTAKEELLFRGAMQIESPRDIQTTIQILQGLDHYQLLYGAEDDVLLTVPAFAAGGDVAGAVEQTWDDAATQIKTVVDNVVFPALSMILAIAFFVKLGMSYFDYRTRDNSNGLVLQSSLFALSSYCWPPITSGASSASKNRRPHPLLIRKGCGYLLERRC